jgi:isochorismate pyruvate lyase
MPTPELRAFRQEIDQLDQQMAILLAKRFRIVDQVIAIKQAKQIPALLPDRIEEVVENAKRRGTELNIPVESMEKLWRLLIAETIRYEETRLTRD